MFVVAGDFTLNFGQEDLYQRRFVSKNCIKIYQLKWRWSEKQFISPFGAFARSVHKPSNLEKKNKIAKTIIHGQNDLLQAVTFPLDK